MTPKIYVNFSPTAKNHQNNKGTPNLHEYRHITLSHISKRKITEKKTDFSGVIS